MGTQAIAEHYNTKLQNGDAPMQEHMKKNGMEAIMKYYGDEELMLKFSQKMGGLPQELNPVLKKIDESPLTLHEAAKNGDLKAVQEFLGKKNGLEAIMKYYSDEELMLKFSKKMGGLPQELNPVL